jgi:adenylate kinase
MSFFSNFFSFSKTPRRILITGPQGSGKTTQGEIIAKKLELCLVNTGELLRELAEGDSEESRIIKEALAKGELADDRIVSSEVKKKISQPECRKGFITDGYPRRIEQLSLFDPKFDKVFYLQVPDDVVEQRLLGRGREDDTPELIQNRLEWYHQEINPLLDHYRKEGKLVTIDGSKSIEEIASEIDKHLR